MTYQEGKYKKYPQAGHGGTCNSNNQKVDEFAVLKLKYCTPTIHLIAPALIVAFGDNVTRTMRHQL